MPKETIKTDIVVEGDETIKQSLNVRWLKPGTVPEAPDSWVNEGYVSVAIHRDIDLHNGEPFVCQIFGADLDEEEIDHLIRVLKRAKRSVFEKPYAKVSPLSERAS